MKKNQFNNTTKITIAFVVCSFLVILGIGIYQSLDTKEEVIYEQEEVVENEEENIDEQIVEDDQEIVVTDQEEIQEDSVEQQAETEQVETETEQEEVEFEEETSSSSTSQQEAISQVSIIIYGVNETMSSGTIQVAQSSTVYEVLLEYTTSQSMELKTSGIGTSIYVKGIGGLNEFDYGGRSGWTYTVNGNYLSMSCGAYEIGEGDVIEWIYANYE
ncbi:DUF4430 domain-containing protein [Tannockella kyphosi]|uniref:DUF4430 domain-containing protein n=1 Tax=Tannockella kyphosi TaxID=2899121 RepID=UPI0020129AB4|nr:DUF4430 domain-containing protein [Tannockella kyphosi]